MTERSRRHMAQRHAVFCKYLCLNLFFRIYIQIFSYNKIQKRIKQIDGDAAPASTARWIGYHVTHASRFVPGANCLSRGMTAQFVLRKQGFGSVMRIGVAEDNKGFRAHAWVLSGDLVVVGNEEGQLDTFHLLTEFGKSDR